MRILHVNNHVGAGGAQRVMLDLAAHQARSGHAVCTAASPVGEWWPQVEGQSFPLAALSGRHGSPVRIVRAAIALRRTMNTVFPDVIHVHQRPLAVAVGLAQIGRQRVPVVEHAHSLAQGRRLISYRWSDAIIAPGEAAAAHLRSAFPAAASKVVCIPNGVVDPGAPHSVGGRVGPIRLVAVGRATIEKDPAWFVDLVATLRSLDVDVEGRWLGDGPLRLELAERVARAGIPVEFPGHSPVARLEMVAADLIVSSSRLEAMPISLLEGQAAGRGIVARDVGAIAELVVPGNNGVLFDIDLPASRAAAELSAVLGPAPRETLARWGAASRSLFEQSHRLETFAAAVEQVYVGAIARRRRRRRTMGQMALAPVAWLLLHACDLLLRLAGLDRALRVVGARGAWDDTATAGPNAFADLGPMRLRLAWAIRRAGTGWRRSDGPCLRQALALALVLRRYEPVIHFGVKRGVATPATHAWTTVGALRFDRDDSYHPFVWQQPS